MQFSPAWTWSSSGRGEGVHPSWEPRESLALCQGEGKQTGVTDIVSACVWESVILQLKGSCLGWKYKQLGVVNEAKF